MSNELGPTESKCAGPVAETNAVDERIRWILNARTLFGGDICARAGAIGKMLSSTGACLADVRKLGGP